MADENHGLIRGRRSPPMSTPPLPPDDLGERTAWVKPMLVRMSAMLHFGNQPVELVAAGQVKALDNRPRVPGACQGIQHLMGVRACAVFASGRGCAQPCVRKRAQCIS